MAIQFSDNIIIPSNYSNINSSILSLSIIPGPSSDPNYLGFNWTTTSCSERILTINITFENPSVIS